MKLLSNEETRAINKHTEDYNFRFAIPVETIQFYWDELPGGCMGKFYEPYTIKLPLWYYQTAMSPRGTLFVSDFIDLLPTIAHEVYHMKQFTEHPIKYKFFKLRFWARWKIEKSAFMEERRVREIIERTLDHGQENYG